MLLFKKTNKITKDKFRKGEIIFQMGEYGEYAYRILEGEVEILISDDEQEVTLAQLGAGEVFGEMGMIGRSPRSATARAMSALKVEVMSEEEFNQRLLKNTDALIPYLSSIFNRTRSLNHQIQELQLKGAGYKKEQSKPILGEELGVKSIYLTADSEFLKRQGSLKNREVDEFPFYIGRRRETAAVDVFQKNQLAIYDEQPYSISRNHCAIEMIDGSVYVRDRGSYAGTIVNGKRINGNGTSVDRVELNAGENSLILGGAKSKIRLKVVIEPN